MANCVRPFYHDIQEMYLPCGKCPPCLARRVSGWSFRLLQEDKVSTSSLFITLTYNEQHIKRSNNGFRTLDRRTVQLFIKRLRKLHSKTNRRTIKYYAVGEYGTKSSRPHYHLLLFNADIGTIQRAWCDLRVLYIRVRGKRILYRKRLATVKTYEPIGDVHYGTVTGASVGYCLKYMSKAPSVPKHGRDDRIKEFSLFSKGLGKSYLTPSVKRWHLADDNRMYCTTNDGIKLSMPRYYKDKIYSDEDREWQGYISLQEKKKRQHRLLTLMRKENIDEKYLISQQSVDAAFLRMYKRSQEKRELL